MITGGYAELTYSAVYDIDHNEYYRVENFDFIGRRHSGSVFLGETLFTFGGAQPEGYNENEDYTTLNSAQLGYMDYDEVDGPNVCEHVDCNNLHFVHVMESELIDEISMSFNISYEDAFNMVVNGEIGLWVHDFNNEDTGGPHYEGRFMTEYNEPEEPIFYYIAEYPNGIPQTRTHYYWVWGIYDESGQFEPQSGEYISDETENCISMIEEGEEFYTRYWDPEDHLEQ